MASKRKSKGLTPRIIRDGIVDEMLVSLGLLQHDLAFDQERGTGTTPKTYFAKLKECIQTLKTCRNELVSIEAQIEQMQLSVTPDAAQLEYLRDQARRIRENVFRRYEEVMAE